MKKKLSISRDDVILYQSNQDTCPVCNAAYTEDGSLPLEYGSLEFEEDFVIQKVSCGECNHEWMNWYKFDGISEIRDEEGDQVFEDVPTRLPDYESIVHNLLESLGKKKSLPLLMGIHDDLDEMLETKLKKGK